MNMQDVYEELKAVLTYFDVRWADKELIEMWTDKDTLHFKYEGKHIAVTVPGEEK
jgi:hypothetical protein